MGPGKIPLAAVFRTSLFSALIIGIRASPCCTEGDLRATPSRKMLIRGNELRPGRSSSARPRKLQKSNYPLTDPSGLGSEEGAFDMSGFPELPDLKDHFKTTDLPTMQAPAAPQPSVWIIAAIIPIVVFVPVVIGCVVVCCLCKRMRHPPAIEATPAAYPARLPEHYQASCVDGQPRSFHTQAIPVVHPARLPEHYQASCADGQPSSFHTNATIVNG